MSAMWMQDAGALSSGNSKLLMFFVGMVAIALVAQAIALIAIAFGALKAGKRALDIADEMRTKLMPIVENKLLPMVESTHEMLQDARPKVKVITDNLLETSHVVRSKALEFDVTASEVNSRTRAQVARVDGMVTSVLNSTSIPLPQAWVPAGADEDGPAQAVQAAGHGHRVGSVPCPDAVGAEDVPPDRGGPGPDLQRLRGGRHSPSSHSRRRARPASPWPDRRPALASQEGFPQYEQNQYWTLALWRRGGPSGAAKAAMKAAVKRAKLVAKAARNGGEDISDAMVEPEAGSADLRVSEVRSSRAPSEVRVSQTSELPEPADLRVSEVTGRGTIWALNS